jgi:pimeloyl-ACP methyl ester carboxylesterase
VPAGPTGSSAERPAFVIILPLTFGLRKYRFDGIMTLSCLRGGRKKMASVLVPARFRLRQRLWVTGALILAMIVAFGDLTEANARPERPVVFIPGILGSKLSDGSRLVWGGRNSLANFAELEITPSGPVKPLKATGLVDRIDVLGPFWVIHQYDDLINTLHKLGYHDDTSNPDLFLFPYDWRESNFDTAKKFDAFVAHTPALRQGRFDLIAHSMGGIVAKIWLTEYGGAAKVRKVIYLGTPFQGSQNAFGTLSDGWGPFANLLAGGIETMRRVMLSFPSIYELLPTYDKCCRLGVPEHYQAINIFDPSIWNKYEWLPPDYRDGGARAAAFADGLSRAKRVRDLMRRDVAGLRQVLFAGDIIATRYYLYVPLDKPSWRNWTFKESRGDGTVPVWSAANNLRLEGSEPSFVEHATIFADQWVRNKLQRELVSNLPPPVRAEVPGEVVTVSGRKTLNLVRTELDPAAAAPGQPSHLRVSLEFEDAVARGDVRPDVTMRGPSVAQTVPVDEVTTGQDLAVRRLVFAGTVTSPDEEGTFQIDVTIPSQGTRSTYLTVLGSPQGER